MDFKNLMDRQRRVFTIPVGKLKPEEVESFIREIQESFKKKPFVDNDYKLPENFIMPTYDIFYPVKKIKWPFFSHSKGKGFYSFRFFGYGLYVKNWHINDLLFSQRNKIKGKIIGKYYFQYLNPES